MVKAVFATSFHDDLSLEVVPYVELELDLVLLVFSVEV